MPARADRLIEMYGVSGRSLFGDLPDPRRFRPPASPGAHQTLRQAVLARRLAAQGLVMLDLREVELRLLARGTTDG